MKIALCFIAVIFALSLLTGSSKPVAHHPAKINTEFFFATNYSEFDIMEGVKAYATALCVNDKATGDSTPELMAAGALCYDSYSSPDDDTSSNDGGWKEYQHTAYLEIVGLCRESRDIYELCKFFK